MNQFLTIKELAHELKRTPQTINIMVREMQKMPERYDDTNFFGKGSKKMVRVAALFDFDAYRDQLKDFPELVPPYDPFKYEQSLGIVERYPSAEDIAKEVVKLLKQ